MRGFRLILKKQFIPGEDRYDFFVRGFCPPNSVLLDRSLIAPADLRADENFSKLEDYRVFAAIAAKYNTDWASIGTAIADYFHRTDATNTVLSHGTDVARRREWDKSLEATRQYISGLTTKVPVGTCAYARCGASPTR